MFSKISLFVLSFGTLFTCSEAGPKTVMVVISGKGGWQETDVKVKKGERIEIKAEGNVRVSRRSMGFVGPEGSTKESWIKRYNIVPEVPHGGIIAEIRPLGLPFFVGEHHIFQAEMDGILAFNVNDTDQEENDGKFRVTITRVD